MKRGVPLYVAAVLIGYVIILVSGCGSEFRPTNQTAQPNTPTAKIADDKDTYEGSKDLLRKEYEKLTQVFAEIETKALIDVANRAEKQLPELRKKYEEAKASSGKESELDRIAEEYGKVCKDSNDAMRAILEKIRPTLNNIGTWHFAMQYTDPKKYESERKEIEELDSSTREVRKSFKPSADLVLPVNDEVRKRMDKDKNADRAALYKQAARVILETKPKPAEPDMSTIPPAKD